MSSAKPPRRTLVLIRHAKSDWSGDQADHDRPLAPRGRRQAPEAGRWIAANVGRVDAALVSSAVRAHRTWELVAAELDRAPDPLVDGRLYSFAGGPLLARVQALPSSVRTAALVSHNPAMEDLVDRLVGKPCVMKTSAIAVVTWSGAWSDGGSAQAKLVAHGRPPQS
jgi:phosphohistidine phosphatase